MVTFKIIVGIVIIFVSILGLLSRNKKKGHVQGRNIGNWKTIPPKSKKIVVGFFIVLVDVALYINVVLIFELNFDKNFWLNFSIFASFIIVLLGAVVLIILGLIDLFRNWLKNRSES